MNPIEKLREEIGVRFPQHQFNFVEPKRNDEDDIWTLEVFVGSRCLVATWRPQGKFEITVSYREDPPGTNRTSLTYADEEKWRDVFIKAVSS